ncbi:MAG: GNAT family N-acetyltransferase [Desulfobacterales bacterium]|nr:GNAT family N-acetyltransferase [Desulfobacterales bacterium]MBS3754212.1 GNAT family N-acetyltransferase [Desulfobacterales bacterium]
MTHQSEPRAEPIEYGPLRTGEERAVIEMVLSSFEAAIAPLYSSQGVAEFKKYASLKEIAFRSRCAHFVCVARQNREPVGMIEIRDHRHISMFFVKSAYQHKGIGRKLLACALNRCIQKNPELAAVTVNASPNAVPAYRHLGFIPNPPEKIINGIRHIPMQKNLTRVC